MKRLARFAVLIPLLSAGPLLAAGQEDCPACAGWNIPQEPFRVHGNTYYVGTEGLSAVLITSEEGHILIDGALPESAGQIEANIRALGFRIEDMRLIVNSHAHFDHAGGIAELQRLSGAEVAASAWSAEALQEGGIMEGDPQFGLGIPFAPVLNARVIEDGETLTVGPLAVTPHFTPGHTPGGTSWSWQSCEGEDCVNIVYADSLSPVSAEGFRFTDRPQGVADFEESFAALESISCDILLTPHPGFAALLEKAAQFHDGAPNPFVDPDACDAYAADMRAWLQRRVAEEESAINRP